MSIFNSTMSKATSYYVTKRNGTKEPIRFDKITDRINKLLDDEIRDDIDVIEIVKETISSIYPGIKTDELDKQSAYQCAMMTTTNYNYALLAGRIAVSNLHKKTGKTFVEKMEFVHDKLNIYDKEWTEFLQKYKSKINRAVKYERDYMFDYFGIKTMEKIYITKYEGKLIERPQDVFMRVCSLVHCGNIDKVIESYELMSNKYFTNASPTLFNAGNKKGNLVSCFLLGTADSITGITKTWHDVSHISKWGGGIGIHVSNIRSKGSQIRSTNGHSDGIIPMLQVYNSIARYINQCFVPDTKIFTDNGFVNIEDIKENMKVITSDGSYQKVNSVFKREVNEEILSFKTEQDNNLLRCTKQHEILVLEDTGYGSCGQIKYKSAGEIEMSDSLLVPMNCGLYNSGEIIGDSDEGTFYINKILSIEKEKYNGYVYDLNIENNHNYLTSSGIVHNSGKRKGSFAIYLEPHHPDVFEFLELRKNTGAESERARDLFLALWVSDLFMKQVKSDGDWYLFCPDQAPGLNDVYGDEYEKLYWKYVEEEKYVEKLKARKLWEAIENAQFETGAPYMSYKDNVNRKTNQKNIGVIKSSNLCNEIVEYSDTNETAACNLASISLPTFMKKKDFSASQFKIYTKPDCIYCKWTKAMVSKRKLNYEIINIIPDSKEYHELKEKLNDPFGKVTFPRVFENDKLIGGMEELYIHLGQEMDYKKLWEVAYNVTENLNNVIDKNYYPTTESRRSNMKHRPIGLGVQGLADVLAMRRVPYSSTKSLDENDKIFGTIYHAALQSSCDIAKEREEEFKLLLDFFEEHPKKKPLGEFYDNDFTCTPKKIEKIYHKLRPHSTELTKTKFLGTYSTFEGSPFSEGKLQYHLWEKEPVNIGELIEGKSWDSLIEDIKKYGTRNSLLTALMPTASTSQLLGNYESFEPFTSNIYSRRTLAGEFVVVNKHLLKDLRELGEWDETTKNVIIEANGSIQNMKLPKIVKDNYLNAYEMKQKWILDGCITRGKYIDQTQSMNLYFPQPDSKKLTSSQFYAWEKGLKTGLYYLRSKPSANARKTTISSSNSIKPSEDDECINCSA